METVFMSAQNQDFYSVDKSSKKFESILGFDFNYPYLSPKKVQNKIQIDNEGILSEMARHITSVRKLNSKILDLRSQNGNNLWYYPVAQMEEFLFTLDKESSVYSYTFQGLDLEQNFFSEFLFSESFFSTKVDGMAVPYRRANEILIDFGSPENDDEQLLFNCNKILKKLFSEDSKELTIDFIKDIYNDLFEDILDPENESFYRQDNDISFQDALSSIHGFNIINSEAVSIYLKDLLLWLNDKKTFFHPILKAAIFYFYILYLQPFSKANGIMARLLFYSCLYHSGYGIMKFLSISEMIDHEKGKYTTAFEESILNQEDISYFLIYIVESLYEAFSQFKKSSDNEAKWLKNQQKINQMHIPINERQLKVMRGFSLAKYENITTEKVEKFCQIGSDTARKDLNDLVKWKLLEKKKDGKSFLYIALDF